MQPRGRPVPTPSIPTFAAVLAAAALLLPAAALAERADRDKPMNVEADALRYDDINQTSVFTGHVIITKGTIVLRGARVDVSQDPQGYQHGVVTAVSATSISVRCVRCCPRRAAPSSRSRSSSPASTPRTRRS